MKVFTTLFTLLALSLPYSAHALLLKCNTLEGRTLWASFGKRLRSQNGQSPVYFPTELTVFANRTELQDRQVFDRTVDALKIPVSFTGSAFAIEFPAKNLAGEIQVERIDLRLYSHRAPKAFSGIWVSIKNSKVIKSERAACSIYN